MSTSEAALDLDRLLESAANDVGEASQLRRRAAEDAGIRRPLQALVEEERRSPEECDPAVAGRMAVANYILGRDGAVGAWAARTRSHRVLYLWGLAELNRDRPLHSAKVFEECLRLEPRDERTRLQLAPLQALLGRPEAAKETIGPLASQTDRSAVLFALGAVAEAEGDYSEARNRYESAHALDPENVDALFRLAFHHDLSGDDDAAIALYERARAVPPPRANLLLNLGVLYEDRGEYERAAECYHEILDHAPNHARARPFLRDAEESKSMVVDEDMERKEDRRNQLLRTPITDFELSVRSRNCLAKMSIQTLGDLIQRTESELLAYKNFGETSLQEIKDLLSQEGLRLGMRRDEVVVTELPTPTLPDVPAADPSALTIPISDLDLSVRAAKCMTMLNVETVGDLLQHPEQELLEMKNFGTTSLQEIKKKLADLGLSLKKA